ncbi:hypothetical protein CRYUN_Cryun14cG0055200 [Craigia yunnanensis]
MQATQNYPQHVAAHVLDGSLGTCVQNPSLNIPFQDSVLHPMGDVHGQTCLRIQLHLNPAAHAAASFAATFWPYANVESSADSPTCSQGGFPSRQMNSAPTMVAIAAATVAAATACSSNGNGQVPDAKTEIKDNNDLDLSMQGQQLDPEYSEALQGQNSAYKSPTSLSSDCEESGDAKVNTGVKAVVDEKAATVTEPQDANKTKNRKQVDRSSCGSNTPSSTEVETDVLEKHEKDEEDSKGADANHPQVECSNRRGRSSSNLSDSRKVVSEVQKENVGEDEQNPDETDGETSTLDHNSKIWGSCSDHQGDEKKALSRDENIVEEGLLMIGLEYEKLNSRRTGFKPYKRCSVEANENRMMNTGGQGEEKGPKRIGLEGESFNLIYAIACN